MSYLEKNIKKQQNQYVNTKTRNQQYEFKKHQQSQHRNFKNSNCKTSVFNFYKKYISVKIKIKKNGKHN